jgi:thiamine kinase-like enzyme
MYDYHSDTAYIPRIDEYPTLEQRTRFLEAYAARNCHSQQEIEDAVRVLEWEIKEWRVVNHAFWCVWGVVMSEDDPDLILPNGNELEDQVVQEERPTDENQGASAADFDYIAYADQKMRLFWGELASGRMYDDYKDGIEGSKAISD